MTESVVSEEKPLPSDWKITLQAGERRFITTRASLVAGSRYFAALLSDRWQNQQDEADGSYFIDADPTLFEHILRYLRHGVFPIFYDASKGHDYALYLALLAQARYFQIPTLEDWLEKERYLEAVIMYNFIHNGMKTMFINVLEEFLHIMDLPIDVEDSA